MWIALPSPRIAAQGADLIPSKYRLIRSSISFLASSRPRSSASNLLT